MLRNNFLKRFYPWGAEAIATPTTRTPKIDTSDDRVMLPTQRTTSRVLILLLLVVMTNMPTQTQSLIWRRGGGIL